MQALLEWKDMSGRKARWVRELRQVGKAFVIESCGETYFENMVSIKFEFQPIEKKCFDDLDPVKIVDAISIITGIVIRRVVLQKLTMLLILMKLLFR